MQSHVWAGADYEIHAPVALSDAPTLRDDLLGLDTEFTGGGVWILGGELRLVQFATEDTGLVLDMRISAHQQAAAAVLRNRNRRFVAHYSHAESNSVYRGLNLDITQRLQCTHKLASLVWADPKNRSIGLKELGLRFLGSLGRDLKDAEDELYELFVDMVKRDGHRFSEAGKVRTHGFTHVDQRDPRYLRYAGLDAVAVRRLYPVLMDLARQKGVSAPIADQMENHAIAGRMTQRGIAVSQPNLDEVARTATKRHVEACDSWFDLTGFKAKSSELKSEYLKTHGVKFIHFNPPKKDGTRSPKLGKEEITELAGLFPDVPGIHTLVEVSETQNVTTFADIVRKHMGFDGRCHPSINTLGTVTGRWSVTDPAIQTASAKTGARRLFVPNSPDEVIVSADLSQIEPRIAFARARAEGLLRRVRNGEDLYGSVAAIVFPDYVPGTKKGLFQRKVCKRIILGTLFGAGVDQLVRQARSQDGWKDADRNAISQARKAFNKSIPEVKRFADQLKEDPVGVRLPSGRVVPNPTNAELKYKNINSYTQGGGADELMFRARAASKAGLDSMLLMCMHDEMILSVPRQRLPEVCATLRDIMEVGFMGCPTPTEIEVYASSWGDDPYLVDPAGRGFINEETKEVTPWKTAILL